MFLCDMMFYIFVLDRILIENEPLTVRTAITPERTARFTSCSYGKFYEDHGWVPAATKRRQIVWFDMGFFRTPQDHPSGTSLNEA